MKCDDCEVESLESRLFLSASRAVDYLPLKAGSWWDFSGTSNGKAVKAHRSVAAKPVTIGGQKTIEIRTSTDATHYDSDYYSFSAGALRINRSGGVSSSSYEIYNKPFVQLPSTFSIGQVFKTSGSWHGVTSNGTAWTGARSEKTTFVRVEKVKVPAGTFSAIRITIDVNLTKNGATWHKTEHDVKTVWLVKGIGKVKMTSVVDDVSTMGTVHTTNSMAMTRYHIA